MQGMGQEINKIIHQSKYPWQGSGISRCNAWYSFKKKNRSANIIVDVFHGGRLKYHNASIFDVGVGRLRVINPDALDKSRVVLQDKYLVEIPNNLDWEIKLVRLKQGKK